MSSSEIAEAYMNWYYQKIQNKNYALVGNPNVRRRDILPKLRGERKYTIDITPSDIGVSNMVYMGFVLSPYPSAIVKKIDVSKVLAAGYYALTEDDLPPFDLYSPIAGTPAPPLLSHRVYYAGQPVAAVAAPSPAEVADAVRLVEVEYEPQPYVFDPIEATQPGAPVLFPPSNLVYTFSVKFGDVEEALSQASVVLSTEREFPNQNHTVTEPRGAVVYWKNGRLYVRAETVYPVGLVQVPLANYFGLPLSDVEVSVALGGFEDGMALGMGMGNKTTSWEIILAAVMAKKTGAAVKVFLDETTQILATGDRFGEKAFIKLGATADGTLTAIDIQLYVNEGALGTGWGSDTVGDLYNLYNVPNVNIQLYGVKTNAYSYSAPYRDVGESQAHFELETAIDELAAKLNMDPVQFRLKNARQLPNCVEPVMKLPYASCVLPDALLKGAEVFGWSSKWKGHGVPSKVVGSKRYGVGVALLNMAKGAISPPSTGQVQVNPDGTVYIYTGFTDHGAGGNTTIPIIVAEALGLTSLDNISVIAADTDLTTDTGGTYGSRTTPNSFGGTILAIQDLVTKWFPIVAKKLNTSPSNLVFGNNMIYDITNPSNSISFKDAAALLTAPIKGYGVWNETPYLQKYAFRVTGAKFVEVWVDVDTAEYKVDNFVSAIGMGQTIFYIGALHQLDGAFVQGIHQAFNEIIYNDPSKGLDRSGGYINPNFLDIPLPTIYENPDSRIPIMINQVNPTGPFGANGIAEGLLAGTSAAIANALSNALGGYRFKKLPIRIDDIVKALEWMKQNGLL